MALRFAVLAAIAVSAAAFQVSSQAAAASSRQIGATPLVRPISARTIHPLLQEDGKPTQLSDETIQNAAATASGGEPSWPTAQPKPVTPDDTSVGPSEGFDPRIIVYVSLPALVLLGQLFFTFSRDALGDAALGPAMMDLYMP